MHNRARIDIGRMEIAYTDEGSGPPLVLLHGAPTTSYVYRHVITHLRGSFRCLAPDYPGWGDSPALRGRAPTLPVLSEVTSAFIEAMDLRGVTLAVMDTAGSSGVYAVERDPGRFNGLVIADTIVFPVADFPMVRRMLGIATSRPFTWLNRRLNVLPWVVSRLGARGRRLSRDEKQAYDSAFASPEARDRVIVPLLDLKENAPFLETVADGLSDIRIPTLLVFGEHDPVRRAGVQRRLEGILPGAASVVIPGEAHFPQEGDPESVAGAILGWAESVGILETGMEAA